MTHEEEREAALSAQWVLYRELTSLAPDALAAQATDTHRAAMNEFVARQLPAYPLPPELTDAEFADAVLSLRRNDGAWNRTLVRADGMALAKDLPQAIETLRSFAAICPWALYAEVARNQACNYEKGEKQP